MSYPSYTTDCYYYHYFYTTEATTPYFASYSVPLDIVARPGSPGEPVI